MNIQIDDAACDELALRSRGTPRIANRFLKRVRDYALVKGDGTITLDIARNALEKQMLMEMDSELIQGAKLNVEYAVKVTNNSEKEYVIIVIRKNEEEVISTNLEI